MKFKEIITLKIHKISYIIYYILYSLIVHPNLVKKKKIIQCSCERHMNIFHKEKCMISNVYISILIITQK